MTFLHPATVFLESSLQDLRFAVRQLLKAPGFTAEAVVMLALGIGVNAAVFTVTNAVLFRGFPHVDPNNRLVYIGSGPQNGEVSYPDYEDWQAQAKSFDGLAVVSNGGLRMRLSDESGSPDVCDGTRLSANAFHVLRHSPILGRDFASSDAVPGAVPVTILSHHLWAQRYGGDPAVIGQTVRLNGTPTTVIGVMDRDFDFPHHRVDLWVPLVPTPDLQERQNRVLWFVFGRMADGVTLQTARAEMDAIGRRLATTYPRTNQGFLPVVVSFGESFFGPNATMIYGAMWGGVAFVLLIACANLANLLLAHAIGRSREISLRIALGAGRWRVIRQLLVESLMLSIVGGFLGWWIARWSVSAYGLVASPPSAYSHWDYTMDYHVFAYLAAISIGTGLLFGLAPASRILKLDVNAALKDGGHCATTGSGGKHLSALLVTGEMALAVVLLAGAGVMIHSFLNIYRADLGFRPANILTASVELPAARYSRPEDRLSFFENLTMHLAAIPGVESIALANSLPGLYAPHFPFELEGAPSVDEHHRTTVASVAISPDYFRTLEAVVLSGRDFNRGDQISGTPVAIVNQRFANTYWRGEDPRGKRLRLFSGPGPNSWLTVVGVASNIVQNDETSQRFDPVVYVPFRQEPEAGRVLARTRVPPGNLQNAFRREIQAIDSDLVIGSGYGSIEGPKPLAESLAFHYWSNGVNGGLFLIFAAISLVLASTGVYAVVAHSVGQQAPEIGIRMALGATARDILALVLRQGMLAVGIGLIIGLGSAAALMPILKSQLVNLSPADPIAYLVATATLIVSATLGCWIPAQRATRIDPVVALRHE